MMKHIRKIIVIFISLIAITNLFAKPYQIEEFKSGNTTKVNQTEFIKFQKKLASNSNYLINYLPKFSIYNYKTAPVYIPENLSSIKKINEIVSLNYYKETEIVSSVLATKTTSSIYNHSLSIYNRLNNNSLEDISTILVKEYQIIKSETLKASGKIEYSLNFSIKKGINENMLFSCWDVDQYEVGNYNNFQIWGSSLPQILAIATFIIEKHIEEKTLKSKNIKNVLPNVFVKSAIYSNGLLKLNIINKTNEKEIKFVGNIANTEVSKHNRVINTYSLSGNYNQILTIETKILFDIGFSLKVKDSMVKDVLYIAEGTWGLDYLDAYATVNDFNIDSAEIKYLDDVYEVDRNAKASGEVKGNINLFRHLLPNDKIVNVEGYNFINFKITNNEPVEIVIMPEKDSSWENRIRYTILPNLEEKEYTIPFNDFLDAQGNSVEINTIKTVVFSIIGDYTNYKPFAISVNELSFIKKETSSTNNFTFSEKRSLINYPNPFTSSTTIQLLINSKNVHIRVYDLMGRLVDVQKIVASSSSKKVRYNAPQLKKGIYKYRLIDDDEDYQYSGTFVVD